MKFQLDDTIDKRRRGLALLIASHVNPSTHEVGNAPLNSNAKETKMMIMTMMIGFILAKVGQSLMATLALPVYLFTRTISIWDSYTKAPSTNCVIVAQTAIGAMGKIPPQPLPLQ